MAVISAVSRVDVERGADDDVPRSKGPATAGVIDARQSGAPL